MPYSPGNNAGNVGTIGNPIVGGTDGSILYVGGGNLSQDNANLFWDAANSRLGIRTSAPATALHVAAGAGTGLRVDDDVILGLNSGNTLTANYGTVTLGANLVETRAAGALAAGSSAVWDRNLSFSGDIGGTTDMSGHRFRADAGGANNIQIVRANRTINTMAQTGTIATGLGIEVVSIVSNTGNVTDHYGLVGNLRWTGAGNSTNAYAFFATTPTFSSTGAATNLGGFVVSNLGHATLVTNAFAFRCGDMTGSATSTRGLWLSLLTGTGKHNLYIDGTATNYLEGQLGIGTAAPSAATKVQVSGTYPTSATFTNVVNLAGTIPSGTTNTCNGYSSAPNTQAAAFVLGTLNHFVSNDVSIGAGSSVSTQVSFLARDCVSATTNRAFQSQQSAGAGNHALYLSGTALSWMAGALLLGPTVFTQRSMGAGNITPQLNLESTGTGTCSIGITSNRADAFGGEIVLAKTRGAAVGSNTIVQNGDQAGTIRFSVADGVNLLNDLAYMRADVEGAPGVGSTPGRLIFATTATGAASGTERLRIGSTGNVQVLNGKLYPSTDAAAIQSVAGIYAGNGLPNNANGSDGDFYLRGDGTVAGNTVIYHKQAGAWVACVTA